MISLDNDSLLLMPQFHAVMNLSNHYEVPTNVYKPLQNNHYKQTNLSHLFKIRRL
jgi:hypothetical protein